MLLLAGIWGLTIPMTKFGVMTIPPLTMTALRFAIAVPLMFVFLIGRPKLPWRAFPGLAALGIFGIGVGQITQSLGVAEISASVGAVISATIPVFIVILAALRLKQAVSARQALGLLAAFVGILLVTTGNGDDAAGTFGSSVTGVGLMVISALALSFYSVWSIELTDAYGPRISMRAIRDQALFGIMAVFLYLGGFALAIEQKVPTGLVALIADLLPLAIAALSQPVLGERLTSRQWAGTVIAVTGVLIVSFDSLSFGSAPAWAYGLTVGSMLVFAVASVLHKKRKTEHMPVHQSLCIHTLTGSVLFGLCALTQGSLAPPMTRDFAIGIAWLVLIATFLAYAVYYTSLRLFPVAKVSAAIYLSPPVTMLWAWMLFSEPLTAAMFAGLAVTLVGVWMTSRN